MNVEAAALIKGVRGPKRVRGSAAGNVGELEHDVAPEKCGVACALSKPTEQKKSHWTVPAPALLSPPMQPSAKAPQQSSRSPGDPGEESVQTQFSEARPHYDGLHSRGTRVGRVCSVAFGLIARRVGRVTRIAMVGCASGRTRTIERDTKGAKTRFIAPAYGKFESSSLQR